MLIQRLATFCLFLCRARLIDAAPHISARQASGTNPYATIIPSTNLTWSQCFQTNFFCALLDVPLDYANPTGSRAYVPWIKYAASTSSSYKGMILTNPGGPGESGVFSLLNEYALAADIIGPNYDIVSFDPRGIGYSVPSANCSTPSTPTVSKRFVDQLHGPSFSVKFFSDFYQSAITLGQQCQAAIGGDHQIGPHMNSAVVVRDIISFLDAYASSNYSIGVVNATLFNYWGFSYGTYIGQIFADMFPDRVGRMVLDAVIDTNSNLAGRELQPTYADEGFSTFFVYCNLAGAANCQFYTGSTSNDILSRFEAIVTSLNPTIANLRGWANASVIELTLETIKLYSYRSTYDPICLAQFPSPCFPDLALFLVAAEALVQNLTMTGYQQLISTYQISDNPIPLEWPAAIQCTDNGNVVYGRSLLSLTPSILAYEAQSYIFGEDTATVQVRCAGWSIVGKGRYPGPFGGPTKTPILFVSTTRDPALPYQNGQKAASKYQGAQHLLVDGTGHTSASLFNNCAFQKIGTFLTTGLLPGSNSFCPQEAGPWGIVATAAQLNARGLEGIQSRVKSLRKHAD